MNKERLMTVLIQPHVSEKAATVAEKANQYVFRVRDDASKAEVKQAVELMFEVKVEGVNLLNKPGKTRRFKNVAGKRNGFKKAYVRLETGQSIDFTGGLGEIRTKAMALIKMKPTSPGTRFVVKVDRSHLHKGGPLESLTTKKNRTGARNHSGRQTTRHIGGGHKQRYRLVDFKRDKDGIPGVVERLEYDPNRTSHLALVLYKDGERRYILAPKGVKAGDEIRSGADAPIKPGNAMPLRHIPVGSTVHNIELKVGKGGQMARSAGGFRAVRGARRRVCQRALEVGRDAQDACRLPRHHRRSRQR